MDGETDLVKRDENRFPNAASYGVLPILEE